LQGHEKEESMKIEPEFVPRITRYFAHRPSARQAAFLLLPHLEAFYGGALGGGKSDALLMAALQYVDVPHYRALIVRESFAALEESGGLIERSRHWLTRTDARWSATDHVWRFPSGATLSFRPLRDEGGEQSFMGSEYQFIGIDELTLITEDQYRFLLTRLRRLKDSDLPLRMRSTGMPHGPGIEWVRRRFVAEGKTYGRPFIPARLEDNEHLDQAAYEAALSNLDPLTRARVRYGDWSVHPEGELFRRSWFSGRTIDETDLPERLRLCRFWDLAATEPRRGTDPDYTAGVLLGRSRDGVFYVCDVARTRETPHAVQRFVARIAERDAIWAKAHRFSPPAIRMEQEPGAAGLGVISDYRRQVLGPYDFRGVPASGSKEVRAYPVASRAEAGELLLVPGRWISEFIDELCAFPQDPHDDQVDALAGAFAHLNSGSHRTYNIVIPDLSGRSYWEDG
jgi:predicted phage terminase large subunit-like protein